MSLLPANRTALETRFPEIYQRLETVSARADVTLFDGGLSLETQTGLCFPHGRENPVGLSDRWAKRNAPLKDGFNLVTGFGVATHVIRAMRGLSNLGRIFVYEPDLTLLRAVLEQVDLSELLAHPCFLLGAGKLDQKSFECLKNEAFDAEGEWKYLPYTPLQILHPADYAEARDLFGKELFLRKNIYRNRSDFAEDFHGTRILNLPYTLLAPDASVLRGQFADVPFVLVAAGPSLDHSYDFLRAIQDKALIACGNSSYEALRAHGIVPHITAAVDFRQDTVKGYANAPIDETVLFCSSYVNPQVLPKFADRIYAWASEGDPLDVSRQRVGKPEGVRIIGEGTLTTSMIQIAEILGCKKICLVAQDLGYPESGQTHVGTSFYADERRNTVEIEDLDPVPGNIAETVYQDGQMRLYQRAVENRLEALESVDVINVSMLGARIRHAPFKQLDEAEAWIGTKASKGVWERLRKPLGERPQVSEEARLIDITLEPVTAYAQKILDRALDLAFSIDALPESAPKPNYANNRQVQECLGKCDTLNAFIGRHPKDHGIIAEGRARPLLLEFADLQKTEVSAVPHWDALVKNREFAWALAEGAFFILHTIQQMEGILEDKKRDQPDS